ncbi:MAG: hypothetical protein GC179_15845 [Anaerolineaceae bacterium]|nr:hypothetical protein [Anaerolineaceae bacterium]
MNQYFDDPDFQSVLAQCTEDILRQHRTLDECLKTYPHYAARLKPLLLASMMTSRLKAPQMSAQSVDALEARLRTQMKRQRRMPLRRTGLSYGLSRLAAVLVIALLLAFGSGAGLVAASSNSLPGDPLYSIKRLWEAIVLALSPLTGPQDVLWQHIAESRLDEVERLAAEGKLNEKVLVDFYGALYHLSGFSSAENDPKIMTLMQNTASTLLAINPPPEAKTVYGEVLRLAQDNVRTGIIQQPPAELPASIIQLTALPTLIPSATASDTAAASPTPSATLTPTRTAVPSSTATVTSSPTLTNTPTFTVTPSRTPRIPATATKTLTPAPSLTFTPTATYTPIAPTATWTDLPLPVPLFTIMPAATQPPPSFVTDVPTNVPNIEATRVRATELSVYLTQTAGPPSATKASPP